MRALLLVALVGCRVTYVNPHAVPTGMVHETTGRFFLMGLVGTKNVAAYQMCPEGVSRVVSRADVFDVLLSAVTLGIYVPRTYEVSCGRAP